MTVVEIDTYKAVRKAADKISAFLNKKENEVIDWEARKWEVFVTLLGKKMVDPKSLMEEAEQIIAMYRGDDDGKSIGKE